MIIHEKRATESLTSDVTESRWSRSRADAIRMDAEIGSYQEDQDPTREDRRDAPPFSQS